MPTRLFLVYDDSVSPPPLYIPRGYSQRDPAWNIWDSESSPARVWNASLLWLRTTRGTGVLSVTNGEPAAGPVDGIALFGSGMTWAFTSYPVTSAFTLSSNVTFNLWGRETSASTNAGWRVRLYKVGALSNAKMLVLDSEHGVELATTNGASNWSATPTSTDFAPGDRLLVLLGLDDAGGTMANTGFIEFYYSGTTGGSSGDSWIELGETISLDETKLPSGSVLYLRDTASDVSIGGRTCKEMWTTQGSSAITISSVHPDGPVALQAAQWSPSGTPIEWYSRPLAPVTFQGPAKLHIPLSTVSGYSGIVAELAFVDQDGSNAQVWALGESGRELFNNGSAYEEHEWLLAGAPYPVAGGRRLRLRLYHDDLYTSTISAPLQSGTSRLKYNGSHTGDASTNADAKLELNVALSEWSGPPGPVTDPYRMTAARVY
jgi:hypothetical protein